MEQILYSRQQAIAYLGGSRAILEVLERHYGLKATIRRHRCVVYHRDRLDAAALRLDAAGLPDHISLCRGKAAAGDGEEGEAC